MTRELFRIDEWAFDHGKRTRSRSVRGWLSLAYAVGIVVVASGCGAQTTNDTGTETHWLRACNSDAECNGGLQCLCNVCTRGCAQADCPSQAPHCVSGAALSCLDNGDNGEVAICYARSEQDLVAERGDAGAAPAPMNLKVPDVDATRPDPSFCDSANWCWESPQAPGERFFAFSSDRQLAVGERGVVFSILEGYLPAPTSTDLTAVVVVGGQPWVGSSAGVWSSSDRGWARRSEVGVNALAVTPNGDVWALRGGGVARLETEAWVDVTPVARRDDVLTFDDLVANDDGSVSVVGSYILDKSTNEGVLFTWDGKTWNEQAAGFNTGRTQFLEGPASPYVYHVPSDSDDDSARVFEPANDWRIVAERQSTPGGTVFWGPDGSWWLGSRGSVFSFDDSSPKADGAITCGTAINWDSRTILCADERGGLNFITASESGAIEAVAGWPTYPAMASGTFGTQPVPVWAQRSEAWGAGATEIWSAPLDRHDGRVWQSLLTEGDDFAAQMIEGSASNDVWFASETELRHWNGRAVTPVDLPIADPNRILGMRVLDASHVWVLLETTTAPFEVVIASYSIRSWAIEYRAEIETTYGHGSIAGASAEALWATVGHRVLRLQDGVWSPHIELAPSDPILHSASDDGSLWLLSDTTVYHLEGAELTPHGYRTGGLQRIALTPEYVWNFDGPYVRKLAR